ncbi:MAG: GNAT family N-acetyltransferase [Elusimicrobiota bacterium]|nr:GNAT family N-acetyltransferase [Elusimicrobiota bacterium]
MELIQYKTTEPRPDACAALIDRVYGAYPGYAAALTKEVLYQLAPENPFLAFGTREGFIAMEGGEPAAHACAITDSRLPGNVGLIGYFEAAGKEAAGAVLSAACGHLAARGITKVYGPVNDTTWQRHGVSIAGEAPPFSGEPFTPAAYAGYFEGSGFAISDRRFSTSIAANELPFGGYRGCYDALVKRGFMFTDLEPGALAPRAREIHAVVNASFTGTPLFVPEGFAEFLYSAGARAAQADGAVFILAHFGLKPAGFLLGLPDGCYEGGDFVFKTIGVMPECRRLGVGSALFYLMQSRLAGRGVRKCIFSTMRDGNAAIQTLTSRAPVLHRGYLTFSRDI